MALAISQKELVDSVADLVEKVGDETVFIQKNGKNVAAIISIAEYESTREAKAQRAIEAMWELREYMQSTASPEELAELEKALDRKAS